MNFDQLRLAGFTAVERLVAERTEESHRLDFKLKTDARRTDLQREDRKALGEAASGFANAVGGLLIIGVETEISNGLDRAKSIVPIEDVEAVADRYASYLTECVTPPVLGLRVSALCAEGSKSGVIVIDIPKGESRPHMSVAPGHHRFYRRVADRFQQMERYEIEEMFSLKGTPDLTLALEYQPGGSIGGNLKTFIAFGLSNTSNVTAKFPFISVVRNAKAPKIAEFGLDGNGGTLFEKVTMGPAQEVLFSGGADIVIHPGQKLFVSRLEYLHGSDERMGRYWAASTLGPQGSCEIEFAFGCEDQPQKKVVARYSCSDLLNHEPPTLSA